MAFLIFLMLWVSVLYSYAALDSASFTHRHEPTELAAILQEFEDLASAEYPELIVVVSETADKEFLLENNPNGYEHLYYKLRLEIGDEEQPDVIRDHTLFYTFDQDELQDLGLMTEYRAMECPPTNVGSFVNTYTFSYKWFEQLKEYFGVAHLNFNEPQFVYENGVLDYEAGEMGCAEKEIIRFKSSTDDNSTDIKVYLDGKRLTFDVPPTVMNGTTLVPMRKIFEELGAEIQWDGANQIVTATYGGKTIKLQIGSKIAGVDGAQIELPVPVHAMDGRTLVPLRFVSESLGSAVGWEGAARSVTISSSPKIEAIVSGYSDDSLIQVMYSDRSGSEVVANVRLAGVELTERLPAEEIVDVMENWLPAGSKIWIEPVVAKHDDGSMLGYVYLTDGTQLNARLIIESLARLDMQSEIMRWDYYFAYLQNHGSMSERG